MTEVSSQDITNTVFVLHLFFCLLCLLFFSLFKGFCVNHLGKYQMEKCTKNLKDTFEYNEVIYSPNPSNGPYEFTY